MNNIKIVKPNDIIFHPITTSIIPNNTKDNMCITKFNINDKQNISDHIKNYNCKYESNNYEKYMYIPPAGISYSDILKIYNIESVDDIIYFIENTNNNFQKKRIINCWIKNNIEQLKKNSNILLKINILLFPNKKKILETDNIKDFVNKWFKKTDDLFYLNYYDDLYNYINKKISQ